MKRLKYIVGLLFVSTSLLVGQSRISTNSISGGKLEFANKVQDFGTIYKDTTLVAEYLFKNTGDKTVHIEFVRPDCICTKYELSKKEIAPGDTARIKLFYNTENQYGKQKVYAVVKADTYERLYKLTIVVNIDVPLEF